MTGERLPEAITRRVSDRLEAGNSVLDIWLWLNRIGYPVRTEDVVIIAARHQRQRDAQNQVVSGMVRAPDR